MSQNAKEPTLKVYYVTAPFVQLGFGPKVKTKLTLKPPPHTRLWNIQQKWTVFCWTPCRYVTSCPEQADPKLSDLILNKLSLVEVEVEVEVGVEVGVVVGFEVGVGLRLDELRCRCK